MVSHLQGSPAGITEREGKKKHKYEMNLMLQQNGMQCSSDLINAQCRLEGLEYFNS